MNADCLTRHTAGTRPEWHRWKWHIQNNWGEKLCFCGRTQGSILQTEVREPRNRTDECRRDVGDSAHISDGDGGAMRSEQFGAEVVNPGRARNSVIVCVEILPVGVETWHAISFPLQTTSLGTEYERHGPRINTCTKRHTLPRQDKDRQR
jgi:hypothetical protein